MEKIRYYSLKSVEGPKDQIGLALKVSLDRNLEDLTGMFNFTETKKKATTDYRANINVSIYGKPLSAEEDIVCLRVNDFGSVEIHKQSNYPMGLEEISKDSAISIVNKLEEVRRLRNINVIGTSDPDCIYW